MNMSYKRAWDLVDEINHLCRRAAVERQAGGKNGGGAVLTPFGLSLVARYRKIERSAESAARKELRALRADIGARPKAWILGIPGQATSRIGPSSPTLVAAWPRRQHRPHPQERLSVTLRHQQRRAISNAAPVPADYMMGITDTAIGESNRI
jgi:molybdate transport repressor ModE-like protein